MILLLPLIVVGVAMSEVIGRVLPPCFFYQKTGLLCPGCGATRAVQAMRVGDFGQAMQNHAMIVILMFLGVLWVLSEILRGWSPTVKGFRVEGWRLWYLWVILGAVLVFTVVRNLPSGGFLRPN